MPGSEIVIRAVEAADRDALLRWRNDPTAYRWFRTDRPVESDEHDRWLADRVAADPADLWVAVLDEPVGSVSLAPDGEVSVTVDVAARGTGVGRALVEFAVDRAAARGLAEIVAAVHRDNLASVRLFEACGFTQPPTNPSPSGQTWLRFVRIVPPRLATRE